jgi:hypothetical protein
MQEDAMAHHQHLGIQEHMRVVGSDGQQVGTVDKLEGEQVKLTRDADGQHHYLPADAIQGVTDGTVRLTMTAAEAKRSWQAEGSGGMPGGTGRGQSQGMGAEAGRRGGEGNASTMSSQSKKPG